MSVYQDSFSPFSAPVRGRTVNRFTNAANGAVGPKGATGAKGVTGAQGLPGDTGLQGLQGAQGLAGAAGFDGVAGNGVMVPGAMLPDINWLPGDLTVPGTVQSNSVTLSSTDKFVDFARLSVAGQVPEPTLTVAGGGVVQAQVTGMYVGYYGRTAVSSSTGNEGISGDPTTNGYTSEPHNFGANGVSDKIPHNLRAKRVNEFYIPIVNVTMDVNQYQFIVNVTRVDNTYIYVNLAKINSQGNGYDMKYYNGQNNTTGDNPYNPMTVNPRVPMTWTCYLVSGLQLLTQEGKQQWLYSY